MKSIGHYYYWIKRDINRWLLNKPYVCDFIMKHHLSLLLKMFYFDYLGIIPNIKHPKNLNEALLKLSVKNYHSTQRDLIVKCADKYKVREYISQKGYEETLNEIYGAYDSVDDIDFNILPNRFVIKMNNASGRNIICKDKKHIDVAEIKETLSIWLADKTFGVKSGEWQYSLMKPLIIIEKYLENNSSTSLIDYKFHCFKGKVYSCFVGYNRNPLCPHEEVCFDDYDFQWNRTENIRSCWHKNNRQLLPKPKCFDQMLVMASDLSKDFDYVRVDLYEVNDTIVFGELTFTPDGCVINDYTEEWLIKAYRDNISAFE